MKTTIHIDDSTTITRTVRNGVISYKNTKYLVFESYGKYKIDVDRPIITAIDGFPEHVILDKAKEILELRFKRQPNMFMESPEAFKTMLQARFSGEQREHFDVLTLDNRHRLISQTTLFSGCIAQASVYPRIVVQHCLKENAAACAIAHNHPSGVPTESRSDVSISQRLKKALALVEVRLLDSFIVTEKAVVSLAEKGEL